MQPIPDTVECGENRWKILGGGDQTDIVRALILQPQKYIGKLIHTQLFAEPAGADPVVLAETASQRAPAEKDRAAAVESADTGLLPHMQGRPRCPQSIRAAAESNPGTPAYSAPPRAKFTFLICISDIHSKIFHRSSTSYHLSVCSTARFAFRPTSRAAGQRQAAIGISISAFPARIKWLTNVYELIKIEKVCAVTKERQQ
jgi:hypothetical protein